MYSQAEEEKYILQSLSLEHGGSWGKFLDIGAFHAETFSNTRALFELGWSGILFEPSPGPLHGLVKAYGNESRIQIIGAAVTVQGGLIEFEITDDAVSMPADSRLVEAWRSVGGFFGKLTVPSLSLKEIFERFGGDFDFVSIDTEGSSVNLFAEMVRLGPRPRCVCVEHDSRFVELAAHAEAANYRQIHLNGTNAIFEWSSGR